MEADRTSETLVYFCETQRRRIPEGSLQLLVANERKNAYLRREALWPELLVPLQ
jgi:hypothetical protein